MSLINSIRKLTDINGVRRYVIEFVKPKTDDSYYFLIREGSMGEIRFDYVKIERLD